MYTKNTKKTDVKVKFLNNKQKQSKINKNVQR